MSQGKKVYITTTLPYVNAEPHVGFAMELVRADVINRFKKILGNDVFFNTGTDEHGVKIFQKAVEEGKDAQQFVDERSEKFWDLIELLNINQDVHFIRTTDDVHIKAAQEMWRRCKANGDIEKKIYKTKYCIGCELEKTDSELVDGHCTIHPNLEIEIRDEENYFFKFSKYQQKLLDLYKNNPDFVTPSSRLNEIKMFTERGVEDFSISRLKEKMPWGVPVPDDEGHVMYVWFDALVSYISTLGWPDESGDFGKYWTKDNEIIQYAGKDNLRQQSAMWQAMLMSAGLPNSKHIVINGFITSGGQKMSKSLGNVINPREVVDVFGAESFRYFVARELSSFEDSDFTMEAFKQAYNSNLANGLGNLVSRLMNLSAKYLDKPVEITNTSLPDEFVALLNNFSIQLAMNMIWKKIGVMDQEIQEKEPFKLIKTDPEKAKAIVHSLVIDLHLLAIMLEPFMPETSKGIKSLIENNSSPVQPLFPRMD
ncbi:MAG: methionine--tRNA ligase [Minisyncoccia bacterium]